MRITQQQRGALAHIFTGQYQAGGRGALCPLRRVPLYNCWGLCMAAALVFGHRLPDVAAPAVVTARAVNGLVDRLRSTFDQLDTPIPGCLVALRTHPRMTRAVNHFGVMLDSSRFVHIQRATQVHVDTITDQPWRQYCAGYWWVRP